MSGPDEHEKLDLAAWPAEEPPPGFADRVLERVTAEQPTVRVRLGKRPFVVVAGAMATLSLAAALALGIRAPSHGEAIAKDRSEVSIGSRARAVLEPGARVSWNGDDVNQSKGDVFYRVEPGARFRVHTPAGDVEVKGTCFAVKVIEMQKRDIKSGAVGAALAAVSFVAVYEGKVAVSHASEHAELGAGDSAELGENGVTKSTLADGQRAFDAKLAEAGDPLATANENLVAQVGDYRKRLEVIAEQKSELEKKLETTEKQLASVQADGAAKPIKHEFDLAADDWKELAKDGTIKARTPCERKGGWTPSPETLQTLGLSPQDGAVLKNAYRHSNERLAAVILPLCAQAIGSAEAAQKLGPDTCQHVVLDIETAKDPEAARAARRLVGEVRAGLRPMPGPNEQIHPIARMFLAVTGEAKSFEAELAETFGPEEAHRLTYSDDMCMGRSTWGGGGKPR